MTKSADAFRTISEVADELDLPQHVLRFWETRFPQVKPLKRAGGRRFYRPADVRLLLAIRQLLYGEGYTIKGVQRLLKEQGARGLQGGARPAGTMSFADEEGGEAESFAMPEEGGSPSSDQDPVAPGLQVPELQVPVRVASGDRDLLAGALESIAECQRILQAVLR